MSKEPKRSETLSLPHPDLLAAYVHQSEFQGFMERRLTAPPDHAAILIRNGEVVDAFQGAHFSIGGFFSRLRSFATGPNNIRILLADLKPFSLQSPIRAITKDKVEVAGVITLELQLDPEHPVNLMGLVNPAGYLTREEVLQRFRPHLTDRVFEAVIGRLDASELRGSAGVQDLLQGQVMREIERVAGRIGLTVLATSVEWALNEVEREAMQTGRLDRAQASLEQGVERLKREIAANQDATEFQWRANTDLAKAKIETDDEIERLVLQKEVELVDAREEAQRRQELQALAHEIDVLTAERAGRMENELAEAGQKIDLNRYRRALTRVDLEIEAMQAAHIAEMKKVSAFSDQEIERRQKMLDLEVSERAQAQSRAHIAGLAEVERSGDAHDARLKLEALEAESRRQQDAIRADADARVAQLRAGAAMSPEQILAINAGLSKDVAAVLVEKARAEGASNDQTMSLMREMVAQATDARVASESQAREMFRMGMEGVSGVAHGAGGKGPAAPIAGGSAPDTVTVDCPKCGRDNSAKAKFCVGCGHKLRN